MSYADYLPLLIMPVAGLAILVAVLLILASQKTDKHHRTPAE